MIYECVVSHMNESRQPKELTSTPCANHQLSAEALKFGSDTCNEQFVVVAVEKGLEAYDAQVSCR